MNKRTIRPNPKKQSAARRARPFGKRNDIRRMTYRTTFWKTPDGKKRSKTELIPVPETIAPVETAPIEIPVPV